MIMSYQDPVRLQVSKLPDNSPAESSSKDERPSATRRWRSGMVSRVKHAPHDHVARPTFILVRAVAVREGVFQQLRQDVSQHRVRKVSTGCRSLGQNPLTSACFRSRQRHCKEENEKVLLGGRPGCNSKSSPSACKAAEGGATIPSIHLVCAISIDRPRLAKLPTSATCCTSARISRGRVQSLHQRLQVGQASPKPPQVPDAADTRERRTRGTGQVRSGEVR